MSFIFSIPAIPTPAEVACLTVTLSQEIEKNIQSAILAEGHIFSCAPVQISDVIEKPGGLQVSWNEVFSKFLAEMKCS